MSDEMSGPTNAIKTFRFDLVPEDSSLLPMRLVCGPQLVIGRNKEECDLVSWFLPRSEENDRETRKLSQVHAILRQEDGHLRIRDADSAAGTLWNQEPVPLGEGLTAPLGPTGRLVLGRHFGISVEWFPVAAPTCAVLRPVTSEPAFRRCLWVTGTRCALQRFQGEAGGPWLMPMPMPLGDGEAADAVVEARQDGLWWRAGKASPVELRSKARLSLAEVRFVVS